MNSIFKNNKINADLKEFINRDCSFGVIAVDDDYKILSVNRTFYELTGYPDNELLFNDCRLLIKNDEFDELFDITIFSRSEAAPQNIKLRIANGDFIDACVSLIPLYNSGELINGAVIAFRFGKTGKSDAAELTGQARSSFNEWSTLEAIFNSRLEGAFTIDKDCVITAFNRSAERITGYTADEALGKKCWEIMNSNHCYNQCPSGGGRLIIPGKNPASVTELHITRKDGGKIPVRVTTAPLFDFEGAHIGAVETFQDITELKNLSNHLEDKFHLHNIIGRSLCMEKIFHLIENVGKSESTILITGESGSGKELVARAIHINSYRRSGPFIAVNCSAFAETLLESELFGHEKGAFTGAIQTKPGRFELAQGGTLFLDEIGEISPKIQIKLLRVLETRQFERVGGTRSIKMDIRLIAATNLDLAEKVKMGLYREDFYYRINVINIHLPPLRERLDDLPLLIQNLLEKYSEKFNKSICSISPAAFNRLKGYEWPGNVRELENVMEHAFLMCQGEMIEPEHLPERFQEYSRRFEAGLKMNISGTPLQYAERTFISNTLKTFNGHRGKTAQALGVDKSTLWRKMKKYKLL